MARAVLPPCRGGLAQVEVLPVRSCQAVGLGLLGLFRFRWVGLLLTGSEFGKFTANPDFNTRQ